VSTLSWQVLVRFFETKKRIGRRVFEGFVVLALSVFLGRRLVRIGMARAPGPRSHSRNPPDHSRLAARSIDWVEDKTPDPMAPVPGTKRELLVWIWYPAAPG